jgi:hypothetical protein
MRIILLLSFLLSTQLGAQSLNEKLAEETCHCIEAINFENFTMKQKENQLGICIMSAISKHKPAFDLAHNGKSISEIDMEKVGEEVGLEMVNLCPFTFMEIVEETEEVNPIQLKIELGKISGIEKSQFNTVNLESGDGSLLKFLWLWDFKGSDYLIKNTYKGKWMNILYSEIPLYDSKKGKYIHFKVIEGIEIGE